MKHRPLIGLIGLASFIFPGQTASSLPPRAQDLQYEATAVNIEVPVRVYRGDDFAADLTLDDFEIEEDGVPQTIDAVYLVKKTEIERKEEPGRTFHPWTSRNFVLAFILTEYLPRAVQAVDLFFDRVFVPGDALTIMTPVKTYNLRPEALSQIPGEKIKGQLLALLKRDIVLGNGDYQNAMRDLEESVQNQNVDTYQVAVDRLRALRNIDQKRLLDFAEFLKKQEGQKTVFLLYQQESVPVAVKAEGEILAPHAAELRGFLPGIEYGLPPSVYRDDLFNVDIVKRAYSDSSITVHFLYITKPIEARWDISRFGRTSDLQFEEKSADIFTSFLEIARATGGLTDSSGNIASSFERAVEASENYYLLYYTPKNNRADGTFRNIRVRIKRSGVRVIHRAGYIAD